MINKSVLKFILPALLVAGLAACSPSDKDSTKQVATLAPAAVQTTDSTQAAASKTVQTPATDSAKPATANEASTAKAATTSKADSSKTSTTSKS